MLHKYFFCKMKTLFRLVSKVTLRSNVKELYNINYKQGDIYKKRSDFPELRESLLPVSH